MEVSKTSMDFEKQATNLLYDLWYTYSERLFERVVDVCDLSPEQVEALRQIYLRPNDFLVVVK
jgi:hypothetical protein